MSMDITVVIPTIPPRWREVQRAVASVMAQTHAAVAISIAQDTGRRGAWHTRQRALDAVQTEWVAFLDDDDEMLPHHLEVLVAAQRATDADVIVPWYEVVGGTDPVPGHRNVHFQHVDGQCVGLHSFGITCLVRMEALNDHFGIPVIRFRERKAEWPAEDWTFWHDLKEAGAVFHKVPETTWRWHHHAQNTSGLPERW